MSPYPTRPTNWEIEDIEESNPSQFAYLDSIGAIHKNLLCDTAMELEKRDNPHVACFLQLPYPLNIEAVWHRIRYRPTIYADLFAKTAHISISWAKRVQFHLTSDPGDDLDSRILITQIAAIVPLWGRRAQYYNQYLTTLTPAELKRNPIVVPLERSWIEGRAMRASEYEESLCRRAYEEMHSVMRVLLPSYSILSLQEAPLSPTLSEFYVMPAPGRLVYNRLPEPIAIKLLKDNHTPVVRTVAAAELQKAMTGPRRQISEFEHQLLAMSRLYKEGEAALSLIGTLSLIEWFLSSRLNVPRVRSDFQPSLSFMLKNDILSFIPEAACSILRKAIDIRDKLVHGSPPTRANLALAGAYPGREYSPASFHVHGLIQTAFEIYKLVNYEQTRRKESASSKPELLQSKSIRSDDALHS